MTSESGTFQISKTEHGLVVTFTTALKKEIAEQVLAVVNEHISDSELKYVALDLGLRNQNNSYLLTVLGHLVKHAKKLDKKLYVARASDVSHRHIEINGFGSSVKFVNQLSEINSEGAPAPGHGHSRPSIKVEFINPFIQATINVLSIQCSYQTTPGRPFVKGTGQLPAYDMAAVIGLTSEAFNGSILICLSHPVYLTIMGRMLGQIYSEVTREIEDGAGELLNIIFGTAKTELNKQGHKIQKAIPTIIRGRELDINSSGGGPAIVLPFESEAGPFFIEITTDIVKAAGTS